MSKRFIDNSILPKSFRKLEPSLKLTWYYLWINCDESGVYEIDEDLFEFENGFELPIEEIKTNFEANTEVSNEKILLKDFIFINQCDFSKLKPDYNPHKPVFRAISKNQLKLNPSLNQASFNLVVEVEVVGEVKVVEEVIVPKKETFPVKKVFSVEVHNCFNNCLRFFPPQLHPNDNSSWLDVIDKLNRIDKVSFDKIEEITKAARLDNFWGKTFLSLPKLRTKQASSGLKYIIVFNEKFKIDKTPFSSINRQTEDVLKKNMEKVSVSIIEQTRN